MVDVSIVIVTHNSLPDVVFCLDSIIHWTRNVRYETIVVDNNSSDRSCERLPERYPGVMFKLLTSNNGFGAGCNVGWTLSQGEYVLFLNPDSILVENSLEDGVRYFEENPPVGIISFKVVDQRYRPQFGFGALPGLWNEVLVTVGLEMPARRRLLRRRYGNQLAEGSPFQIGWVAGACMMVRRSTLEQIRGFDERFFLFHEDIDICVRAEQAGWNTCYLPGTTIIHSAGHSTGRNHRLLIYSRYQSKLLYARKHLSPLSRELVRLLSVIGLAGRLLASLVYGFDSEEEQRGRRRGYWDSLRMCLKNG